MLQWGVQLHSRSDGVFVREGSEGGAWEPNHALFIIPFKLHGDSQTGQELSQKGNGCMHAVQCMLCDAATDDAGIAHRTSSPPPSHLHPFQGPFAALS